MVEIFAVERMAKAADEPRARIMSAARIEFFSHGFARTTMDDLAGQLGMSKKTLYQHFRSKEEIIGAIIEQKAGEIKLGFDEIFARVAESFFERVGAVFRHIRHQLGELNSVFFRDLKRYQPGLYSQLEGFRSKIFPQAWERLLNEGVQSGDLRSDLNARETAYMVLVFLDAIMQPEHFAHLRVAPHQLAGRVFDLIFTGMLTPAGLEAYENNKPEL